MIYGNENRQHIPHSKRLTTFVLALVAALGMYAPAAASEAIPKPVDIVAVIDISGSMSDFDDGNVIKSVVQLIVDIAPEDARVGMITVNDDVESKLDLTSTSDSNSRNVLYSFISSISYQGNTNFAAGLEEAVTMLEAAGSDSEKHIIFIGDFSEGGYNASYDDEGNISLINRISSRAVNSGIAIDMLLMGEPPETSVVAPALEQLPAVTDGLTVRESSAEALLGQVEQLLMDSFDYHGNSETHRLTGGQQTVSVDFPSPHINRATVYIPTTGMDVDIRASYAGADLYIEDTGYYSIIHLSRPSQAPIDLTFTLDEPGYATVYSFFEYALEAQITTYSDMVQLDDGE